MRKITKWQRFVKRHAGQGHSMTTLSQMYHKRYNRAHYNGGEPVIDLNDKYTRLILQVGRENTYPNYDDFMDFLKDNNGQIGNIVISPFMLKPLQRYLDGMGYGVQGGDQKIREYRTKLADQLTGKRIGWILDKGATFPVNDYKEHIRKIPITISTCQKCRTDIGSRKSSPRMLIVAMDRKDAATCERWKDFETRNGLQYGIQYDTYGNPFYDYTLGVGRTYMGCQPKDRHEPK